MTSVSYRFDEMYIFFSLSYIGMDSSDELDMEEGSGRLMDLTKVLNLDDLDKSLNPICQQLPFVDDFLRLREHICQQKKILCIYGLDSSLFDDMLFKKMQILASQLVFHSSSAIAYCNLRSSLVLEATEFFDEVFAEVEIRLMSCKSEDETERILRFADRLRNIYDIYM